MFNNKLKKAGSGAALLAAAPTLAFQAQGGEAAAVNSPQDLNIVGKSFKSAGNSASKVIKVLPWVGAVGLVLFLAYWAYCVKSNLSLPKRYEDQILKYEEDLKNCELKLEKVKDNIKEKTEENKEINKRILAEVEKKDEICNQLVEPKKVLDRYIKEDAIWTSVLKEIKDEAESLEKDISRCHFEEEMKHIKTLLEDIKKENSKLIIDDLLNKNGKELLTLLTEERVADMERFVRNKVMYSTTYSGGRIMNNKLEPTIPRSNPRFKKFSELRAAVVCANEHVKKIKEYKESKKIDGKEIFDRILALIEKVKGAKKEYDDHIGCYDYPLLDYFVDERGTSLQFLSHYHYRGLYSEIEKKSFDCSDCLRCKRVCFGLHKLSEEVVELMRLINKNISCTTIKVKELEKKITASEKIIEGNKDRKKALEQRKKELEELQERKNKEISDAKAKVLKTKDRLEELKRKLDKNFWKPYPYSYENNAQ